MPANPIGYVCDLCRSSSTNCTHIRLETRSVRMLLLYDRNQVVVARTTVPVRDITMAKLERLRDDLAPVFGREWMQ